MSRAGKIASIFGTGTTINPALVVVPAAVPPNTMVPFSGASAPTDWLFCYGQAISRTTYAALFTAISTTFGVGDGSTTFNLPEMRGRLAAGKDDMGGTAASRLSVTLTGTKASTSNGNITGLSSTAGLAVGMKAFGTGIGANAVITAITSGTAVTLSVNSTSTGSTAIRFAVVDGATLGAVGGAHVHTLSVEQIPAHSHTTTAPASPTQLGYSGFSDNSVLNGVPGSAGDVSGTTGSGNAHPIMPPTMVLNYVIKT